MLWCPPSLWLLQSFLPLFQGLPQSPERRDPMETSNSIHIMSGCESLKSNLSRWRKICVKQFFQPYRVPEWSQQCCVLAVFSAVVRAVSPSARQLHPSFPCLHSPASDASQPTPSPPPDQELCPAHQHQWPCLLTLLPLFMWHGCCPLCMNASCCTEITLKTYDILNSAPSFCWQCWLAWARRMVAPEIL